MSGLPNVEAFVQCAASSCLNDFPHALGICAAEDLFDAVSRSEILGMVLRSIAMIDLNEVGVVGRILLWLGHRSLDDA